MTTLDDGARPGIDAHPRAGRTLGRALAEAERRLAAAAVPSPRTDAELLAGHLLDVGRGELWAHRDDPVPPAFDDLVARRAERIPLQHLTGRAYFRTVTLAVGPGVFSPRPETEVVVGHALDVLGEYGPQPLVADLCAGSGAIAAAVATEAPHAEVHAVERDPGAHPWLSHNAELHGFTAHMQDIDGCMPHLDGLVDVVVANPPYIPVDCVPRDPEVARFDPAMALYSGTDGLAHMRLVEEAAARLLRPGGHVVVEHGDLQGRSAPAVFAGTGRWQDVHDHTDLNGRDRYLTARRAAADAS
jgi:release factor glutamine methyltransferase